MMVQIRSTPTWYELRLGMNVQTIPYGAGVVVATVEAAGADTQIKVKLGSGRAAWFLAEELTTDGRMSTT